MNVTPPLHVAVNGWFVGQTATGSGQYLHHLLDHLPRHASGLRLSLLVPAGVDASACGPGVEVVEVALPPLPGPLRKLWWEQVAVPWTAWRLGAGVLWVPYWAAPAWQPLPTAVTVHDLIPALLPAYRGGRLNRLYTALVGWTARRARAVLAVSHAGAADITAHLGIPPARIHVVHHGPNAPTGAPTDAATDAATVRTRYALPPRYFLYLGGFDVRKNLAGILAGYARYLEQGGDPAVKLVIGGKLPGRDSDFSPDPRRLAREAGLGEEQVHFLGWVEEADKPALYAGAAAYLFPSHYEGFGMMVLEAMAAGAPVITSAP